MEDIFFRKIIKDILVEDKEKPKEEKPKEEKPKEEKPKEEKITSGKGGVEASTGSGRFTKGVNEAGALASEDPSKLMENLKISSKASGNNDLEKIESLLKQAFTGADAMKQVYTSFSRVSKRGKPGLKVGISLIKEREAVKYLYHTLIGASNAKFISFDSLVQVENVGNDIIVYNGKKKTWE